MEFNDLVKFSEWVRITGNEKKIYVVGAGRYGEIVGKYFNSNQLSWQGYIDKNKELTQVNGKPVITYEDIEEKDSYFIISSKARQDLLVEELIKVHVHKENIMTFFSRDILFEMMETAINYKEYTSKVKKFKNLYAGKRCFVVGNGPSLQLKDLELLKNEITFAANGIYLLYPHTTWRPNFYCTHDTLFGNVEMDTEEKIDQKISECEAAFTNVVLKAFEYRDRFDNLYFLQIAGGCEGKKSLPFFSAECSEKVYAINTVTYMMLQLAAYMGFSEIYLLGIDCNYVIEKTRSGEIVKYDVKKHQELIGVKDEIYEKMSIATGEGLAVDVDFMLDGYRAARKYAEKKEIKIYNATRGGKLEIFERVDFDALFD